MACAHANAHTCISILYLHKEETKFLCLFAYHLKTSAEVPALTAIAYSNGKAPKLYKVFLQQRLTDDVQQCGLKKGLSLSNSGSSNY